MCFEDSRTKMNVKVDRSMESKPFVVAAIPAFNEEKTIARMVLLAQRCLDKILFTVDANGIY